MESRGRSKRAWIAGASLVVLAALFWSLTPGTRDGAEPGGASPLPEAAPDPGRTHGPGRDGGVEAAARSGAASDLLAERVRDRLAAVVEAGALAADNPRTASHRVRDRTSASALALLRAGGSLRSIGAERRSGSGQIVRSQLFKQQRPVLNRRVVIELDAEGQIIGREGTVTLPPLRDHAAILGREAAVSMAEAKAGIEMLRAEPRATLGWYALPGATVPAWQVQLPSARPFGTWQVTLDASSGELLSLIDRLRRATGSGSVFDPNVALAPVPSIVPLFDLDASGGLTGDFTRIVDFRNPAAFVPSLAFVFPPSDPRFVQTSVYRGLTDTGRFAVAAGFAPFSAALPAFTNLTDPNTGGEFNNAFYDPVLQLFGFGNGDGAVTANLGTDRDVAAHEMGHHLFEELVVPDIQSSQDPILAMHEGVADTVAALLGGDPNIGESTIPGQPFLRTVANSKIFPDDDSLDPHLTGLIYGGANWELAQLLGTSAFTSLLFDALARLPSDASESEYRDAFLQANLATRAGANQTAIAAIFTARGFDDTEPPAEFEGVLELGMPEARFLPDSPNDPDPANWNFDLFVFQEFPGSTSLTFQTTGSGDVDFIVAPLNDINALALTSQNPGSNETIVVNGSTLPSVNDDDDWLVAVFDFPDGLASSYTLSAQATSPPSQTFINGPAFQGDIATQGEIDFVTFQNFLPGTVVRVEAEALDATLDPIAAVVTVPDFDVLAVDDDAGPGTDALIQGVLLAGPGTFSVAVLSATADIDPTIGTGRYLVRLTTCNNLVGPDTDSDGLVDACDDDDDDDGFIDADDSGRLDPLQCTDIDGDDCDDCVSGSFDFFADGPDLDADGLCDSGDVDDDNDGCTDLTDAAPATPSPDGDLDFLGNDCDNCRQVANPAQTNTDADSFGNACDCDFDQSGTCDIGDFNVFLPNFSSATDNGTGTDMDGDGVVGIGDFNLFLPGFRAGAPGP